MPSLRYAMLRGQYTRGRQPLAADGRRWAVAHCRCPRRGDPRPWPRLPPGTRGLHPLCLRAGTYCGRYRSVLLSEQPYRVPFLWGTRPASASAQRPPLPCGACDAAIPRPCSSPAQGGSFLLVRVRVLLFFFSTRMSTSSIVFSRTSTRRRRHTAARQGWVLVQGTSTCIATAVRVPPPQACVPPHLCLFSVSRFPASCLMISVARSPVETLGVPRFLGS